MSLEQVIARIQEKNIGVLLDGGELVIRAPQGAMDAETMCLLKHHKQSLIELLQTWNDDSIRIKSAPSSASITPTKLPLIELSQTDIDRIVETASGGIGNIQDIYPLAPLQSGILFHHLMDAEGDTYLSRSILAFDSRESVDRFVAALQQVIERHDILRTSVAWQDLPQPVQVVCRKALLPVHELAAPSGGALASLLAASDPSHVRLDLGKAPLLAAYVIAEPQNGEWLLALLNHHIVCDHISLEFIIGEIRLLLNGRANELPPAFPYRNFIAQLRLLDPDKHECYFREQLGDVIEPTAPFGILDMKNCGEITEAKTAIADSLTGRIRTQIKRYGVSAAVLYHLAWARVLAQCCGQDDVVFGTVLTGRMWGGEGIERTVGMFINTLPLRIRVGEVSVAKALAATQQQLTGLIAHEQASLALAQRCSGVDSGLPLFTALLNYRHSQQTDEDSANPWPGMRVVVGGEERTNYPITLTVDDFGDGYALTMQCVRSLQPDKLNEYMSTSLEDIVSALETNPQLLMRTISVVGGIEHRQILVDWNVSEVDYPQDRCIHQLFEAQAVKTPDAIALSFEDQHLTYAGLNAHANQLAHYLIERGVGPDVLVGICLERSLDMVIGLLGILKAGGAYVPLDPGYPEERLAFMLTDIAPSVVLTQDRFAGLDYAGAQALILDSDWANVAVHPADNPRPNLMRGNLAYCIYTSGSTGKPKGAGVPHQGILNRLQWMQDEYGLDGTDAVLQKTPYSFDVSVWEFFWPLMTGARLVVAAPDLHKDSQGLIELIRRTDITTIHFVPSMLQAFVDTPGVERCTNLKRVICSGEALPAELVQRFQQKLPAALHNLYGPTEASVDVSYWACPQDCQETAIPIGKPIANIRLYILDSSLNPVPIGTPGELHIGGIGLGRGYLNRPDLTAEKFIPDPFGPAGSRLYKTGDLTRYRPDGNIDYLGRIDHQVKIRGFRIELGEIEAQLMAYPSIKEAVVLAREDQPNDKRLVAYLVESETGTTQIDSLKARLKDVLPDYMVPSAFVLLDEMPLSANGKLDRKRLMPPGVSEQRCKQYIAPDTQTETILSEIWQEILGLEQVGIEDNFFELGGHSLLATQLYFLVQKRLAATVAFNVFLTEPTVAAQARLIDGETGQTIDFDAEAVLDPAIVPLATKVIDVAAARTIFLTGATGFLGVFLLADLLEHSQADIYCLVRARDERQAMVRLQQQVGLYELTERVDFSRVITVCGDLAESNFGLSESRYREIAERSEVIYHNGALVNFVQPYQTLKAANVTGTEEVLRLACRGRPKAIHYVSTVSVFSEAPRYVTGHKETDEPEQHGNLPNGYAESKWVAEKLVVAARERGFQVSIYRPAIVAGYCRSGAWNTGDFWCRLIKGCLQMSYAPRERIRIDMAPVDYMSRAIVALSQQTDAVGSIFHLNHPEPPYSDDWLDFYTSLGYRLQRIPYRDWLEKVLEFGRSNPNGFALASLLPMFAEQLHDGDAQLPVDGGPLYDSRVTHKVLSALGVKCELLDRNIMARYQDYFIRSGFVVEPDGVENDGANRLPNVNTGMC